MHRLLRRLEGSTGGDRDDLATGHGSNLVHLIRNTFRLTSRRYWDELKRDVKPIYTAVNEPAARAAFDELAAKWAKRYPALIRLWDNAWPEFTPFLDYDIEIRRVLSTTNAIESLNARYRRAVKTRGHFPTDDALIKLLYLGCRDLGRTGQHTDRRGHGSGRGAYAWKTALNQFDIMFPGRLDRA